MRSWKDHLVSYDLARDVGLISIRTAVPLAVARIAPPGHRLLPGDRATSIEEAMTERTPTATG